MLAEWRGPNANSIQVSFAVLLCLVEAKTWLGVCGRRVASEWHRSFEARVCNEYTADNSTGTQRFQVKHKTNIRMGTIDTVSDSGNTCPSLLARYLCSLQQHNTHTHAPVPVQLARLGSMSISIGGTNTHQYNTLTSSRITDKPN